MAENRYIDLLKNRGFFCFFCTQFLGAFNDNFYKIIVTLVALDLPATASGANPYIPLIGGLFILPFLLFSGYAGYLADIHGKRTFLAIILGTSLGGAIYEAWKDRLGWIGVILIAIAALGTLTSLGITKVPPSGASKNFILNPFKEFWKGAKMLYADQPLWLTVMG